MELFIGNPTRATAPPSGAVSTVFILILLRVVQAPGEAAAAQRTWQRAPIQVQILLCENTSHRQRCTDFHMYMGDRGVKVKDLLPSTSCPLLFYSSAQTARVRANVNGNKRILLRQQTSMGRRLADSTGAIPLLMLGSPSLSPGHLSSADVHALSIPGPHPGHIW